MKISATSMGAGAPATNLAVCACAHSEATGINMMRVVVMMAMENAMARVVDMFKGTGESRTNRLRRLGCQEPAPTVAPILQVHGSRSAQ